MTHLCRCAVEFRRTRTLRPPPKPDEWNHVNPVRHVVEFRHSRLHITASIWAISWPNDRHEIRRLGRFRWRCHYTRDRARTRAWSRWGSSAPNPAVQFPSSILLVY